MLGIIRRVFSFSDWTQHHPTEQPPGDMLDASFDAQNSRIAELERLVLTLVRDDGRLQNDIVGLDSLTPEFLSRFNAILKRSIEDVASNVRIPAENAVNSGAAAVEAAENAEMAAARAQSAQNSVESAKNQALSLILDVETRVKELKAVVKQVEQRYVTDSQDWDDAASEAEAWAYSSALWAEHMPDTLPDNALKVMDVTGDHWSSRWWANQAANAFGMLTSLYLGVHSDPPTTNNNGGPIEPGSIYYDAEDQIPYVWTGSGWEPFYQGVSHAAAMSLWYESTAGQTVFPLTTPDLAGVTYAINATKPEGIFAYVNGVKLMPVADWSVNNATSTVTFLRPLRAGDAVCFDMMIPPEQLGPGNVFSWILKPLVGINGVVTTFALETRDGAGPVVNAHKPDELIVSVDGVLQEPVTSYLASGSTITFVTAPSADSHVFITWLQSDGGSGVGGGGGGSTAWADITGKPATFPPTLPIAQSGVTNLTTDQATQDTAIAARLLKAGDSMTGVLGLTAGSATAAAVHFGTAGTGLYGTSALVGVTVAGTFKMTIAANSMDFNSGFKVATAPSSTTRAGFQLQHGAAPTSPSNGDLWTTTAGLYSRINGVNIGPFVDATALALKLDASAYTAADVLTKVKTVDGAGSGLDTELINGKKITVASSAPGSPATNDVWIDTT